MIELKQVKKTPEFNDVVIIHDTRIGRLYSGLVQCLGKDGYWIEWSGSAKAGSFYELESKQVKELKIVNVYIDGQLINGEQLDWFIKKVIKRGITVEKESLSLSWSFMYPPSDGGI